MSSSSGIRRRCHRWCRRRRDRRRLVRGASLATATFNLDGGDNVFSAKGGDGTGDSPVGSYCVFDPLDPDLVVPYHALLDSATWV